MRRQENFGVRTCFPSCHKTVAPSFGLGRSRPVQGTSIPMQVEEPYGNLNWSIVKMVREKSRERHNYKPQPFPDTKRKRKQTKSNKRKSNKRTNSTKISSLFPKRSNRNAKRTEKYKNKT